MSQVKKINIRGVLDGYAYTDEKVWQTMLDLNNLNVNQLRDSRYDAVLHLVTSADGASEYNVFINRFYLNDAQYRNHGELTDAI